MFSCWYEGKRFLRTLSMVPLACGYEGKIHEVTQWGFLVSSTRLCSLGREGEAKCEMTTRGFLVSEARLLPSALAIPCICTQCQTRPHSAWWQQEDSWWTRHARSPRFPPLLHHLHFIARSIEKGNTVDWNGFLQYIVYPNNFTEKLIKYWNFEILFINVSHNIATSNNDYAAKLDFIWLTR